MLIGEMLRRAKLVTLADLTNAIQVAGKTGLPVGRVLVMLGLITNETLQSALIAQSMVRDRMITLDQSVKAIGIVASYRISLDEALERLGCMSEVAECTNKLGELLTAAHIITNRQLDEALNTSQHLGLPLGRVLTFKHWVAQGLIEAALNVQVLVRDGLITREQGIRALRHAKGPHWRIEEPLQAMGLEIEAKEKPSVRIGELFTQADLISESDLLSSIEVGLSEGVPVGQVLVATGLVNQTVLEAALGLQDMVRNEVLGIVEAVQALKLVAENGMSLEQSLAQVSPPPAVIDDVIGLMEILKLSGFLTDAALDHAIKSDPRIVKPFEGVLLNTGNVTEATLQVACRCRALMNDGFITAEQAIVALHYWRWSGASLADILERFGWKSPKTNLRRTVHDLPIAQIDPGLKVVPITTKKSKEMDELPVLSSTDQQSIDQ